MWAASPFSPNPKFEDIMKLLRYGPAGHEKPGCLDAEGRVRDLSGHVDDIAGEALLPEAIAALKALDVS